MKSFQKITSRDNQNLKFARRVRDGKEEGSIFIEGRRLAEESVAAGIQPTHLFAASHFVEKDGFGDLLRELDETAVQVFELTDDIFDSISDTENPQGIILLADRPVSPSDDLALELEFGKAKLPIVIYLYRINNPANLGAVARAAEAAGAVGLITSPGSADPYSAKSLRGSMGSLFRLPVWQDVTVEEAIAWCNASGFATAGTSLEGSKSYLDLDWRKPRMLMFGSEGHGIPADVSELLNELVHIPMEQSVESLNLAVSAGVILFEARRQQLEDQ